MNHLLEQLKNYPRIRDISHIFYLFRFQTCKFGRVQHLEHLLFYGADFDAQNASGNTPLHVCAANNRVGT